MTPTYSYKNFENPKQYKYKEKLLSYIILQLTEQIKDREKIKIISEILKLV